MKSKPVLLIAAGGTGGHMFPAEALAWEFYKLDWLVVLITDERGLRFSNKFPPNIIKFVQESSSLVFRNPFRFSKAILLILISVFQTLRVFIKLKPKVVIGFGGYPSFPVILTAKLLNVKSVVHEQNAVLGRVNKLFSKSVKMVACSFWPTKAPQGAKICFTGNPIRSGVLEKGHRPFDLPLTGQLNLVVIGGSQGASIFSRVVPEAVAILPAKLRSRLIIVQQARSEDCKKLEEIYKKIGVKATVKDFFQNIERIFSCAHLVIARAGASTISEVLFFGKPLLLIPIPFSVLDHQKLNAQRLSELGGAICLEEINLTGNQLSQQINSILINQELANNLAKSAFKNATPQAVEKLRDLVINISEGNISAK